jgi:prepilin-type N-terminal cleavage/methylation domain-containing protein
MKSDRGFTLIELLVTSVLTVLVLSIVGGMLISSMTTESTVKDSTESTSAGQLVSSSVTHGVRAASALTLTSPTPDTQLLRALIIDDVLSSPVVAHCESWFYGDGVIRTERSNTAIAVPASSAGVADWTLLADGVERVGATPVFALTGLTLDLTMQVAGDRGLTVLIDTTAVSRQPGQLPAGVASLCF